MRYKRALFILGVPFLHVEISNCLVYNFFHISGINYTFPKFLGIGLLNFEKKLYCSWSLYAANLTYNLSSDRSS